MGDCTVCPAAIALDGPPAAGPSVVCGVMKVRFDELDSILDGAGRGILLTTRDDPSKVRHFCNGTALPVVDAHVTGQAHYTNCDIWRWGRARDWEDRAREADPVADDPLPTVDQLADTLQETTIRDPRGRLTPEQETREMVGG